MWQRENLCRFWGEVAAGLSSEDAAVEAGVSAPVGVTTFRTGSPASLERLTASPLRVLSWYGKGGGPFIGKVDAGPKLGARNRLRGV